MKRKIERVFAFAGHTRRDGNRAMALALALFAPALYLTAAAASAEGPATIVSRNGIGLIMCGRPLSPPGD